MNKLHKSPISSTEVRCTTVYFRSRLQQFLLAWKAVLPMDLRHNLVSL